MEAVIVNKDNFKSINKKIKLLEYKYFLQDKSKFKNEDFKMISSKDKFKSKIKHFLNFIVNLYRVKKSKPDIIHCFLPFAYM